MAEDTQPPARAYALWPLRIGLALVFLYTGYNKFADLAGTADMFEAWGFPLAGTTVFLVALAEFFGGLGLLMGVLSRFSSVVLSVVMATAIVVVRVPGPFFPGGWALDWALLSGLVTIAINGPGRPTLWSVLQREHLDPEDRLWARLRGSPA